MNEELEIKRVLEFHKVLNIDTDEAESYLAHKDDPEYDRDDLESDKEMWLYAVSEFETAKEFMRPIILSEIENQ